MKHLRPLVLAVIAAVALSGCSLLSPQQTKYEYTPADGIQKSLGNGIELRNIALVTEKAGSPATLLGSVLNRSSEDASIIFFVSGADTSHEVVIPSGQTVKLGTKKHDVTVSRLVSARNTELHPGETQLVEVNFKGTPNSQRQVFVVPILSAGREMFKGAVNTPTETPTPINTDAAATTQAPDDAANTGSTTTASESPAVPENTATDGAEPSDTPTAAETN